MSTRRDEPGWDELPLREGEPGHAAENLPLFEADPSPPVAGTKSKRRASRPAEAAAGPIAREADALEVHEAHDPPARRTAPLPEPQWVQTALADPLDDAATLDEGGRPQPAAGPAVFDVAAPAAQRPALLERLLAGLADGVLHLAVVAATVVAESLLGLQPAPDQWPGFLAFLLCFSFLYTTIPLAFWGQTPGMAWRGLRARDRTDGQLDFGQSALRWLGTWLTVALAGLPGLLALGGRSLADRLSRSETTAEA